MFSKNTRHTIENADKWFWPRVSKSPDPDGCWEWTGYKVRGYGRVAWSGRRCFLAHRVAVIIADGDVASDAVIAHKCNNPSCVRRTHLHVGTHKDNRQDYLLATYGPDREPSEPLSFAFPSHVVSQMPRGRRGIEPNPRTSFLNSAIKHLSNVTSTNAIACEVIRGVARGLPSISWVEYVKFSVRITDSNRQYLDGLAEEFGVARYHVALLAVFWYLEHLQRHPDAQPYGAVA